MAECGIVVKKRALRALLKKISYLALVAVAMIADWLIFQGLQQINVDLHYSVFFAIFSHRLANNQ